MQQYLKMHDFVKLKPGVLNTLWSFFGNRAPGKFIKYMNKCEHNFTDELAQKLLGNLKDARYIEEMADLIDGGLNPSRAAEMGKVPVRLSEAIKRAMGLSDGKVSPWMNKAAKTYYDDLDLIEALEKWAERLY